MYHGAPRNPWWAPESSIRPRLGYPTVCLIIVDIFWRQWLGIMWSPTFHKVASEHPFPDFGYPFGILSASLGTQMTLRKRKRSIHKTHKNTSPKRYQRGLPKELNPDQIQTKSKPFWHHFGTLDREWASGLNFCWFRIDFWRFGRLFWWNCSFLSTWCDTDSLSISASVSIALRHPALSVVKNGLPVPAVKITTKSLANSWIARRLS